MLFALVFLICSLYVVHLQFDGFDDEVYQKIRGQKLLDIKFQALNNLKKLGLSVDLKVTVVKGVNEKEMSKILKFALNKTLSR